MAKIKCLIIDDEELARTLLKTYIQKLDSLYLVDSLENPLNALQTIKDHDIDLLFLDIQMPELKGTDFAKLLPTGIHVIFTTAYSEYALEGYELNVLDYLVKPITFERFLKAVNKVQIKSVPPPSNELDTLTVKSGYDLHKVKYQDILFIESDSEYVIYHTAQTKILSNQSLKKLEENLPADLFMRVHRSFIVNRKKVTALKGRDLIIGDHRIPVSTRYYDSVKERLF
ncbi:LytR/AlgR family response regulator transcription factor [Maribacter polysaccharolyticus]|uniref:LytR/AlgR family response regulator transcription factor n=1 Tax=Maribacter polysaccharolyticus TaxID=3020831 RepID=UPI00237FAA32|nr:LytTR family DNA-binding domain-containing protein [Maribacter polysaccharolyticus]MDE3742396.1 LytTR family DNA-binding domain-containing protein [Maribacter polysaccharolyticus]